MVGRLAIQAKALYMEAFGEMGWLESLWAAPTNSICLEADELPSQGGVLTAVLIRVDPAASIQRGRTNLERHLRQDLGLRVVEAEIQSS